MSTSPVNTWKVLAWMRSVLFLLAAGVLAVALVLLSMHPGARIRLDATKTRSYSLSPRSQQLLENLDGRWQIAVVMVESETDTAVVRQIDEVLDRAAAMARDLEVERIDPSDPAALVSYEELLLDLRDRELENIVEYETAIRDGQSAFAELIAQATASADMINRLQGDETGSSAAAQELLPLASALQLLGRQGHLVLEHVAKSMKPEETDPLPDLAVARSTLLEGLQRWSRELKAGARRINRMETGTPHMQLWQELRDSLSSEASSLAVAADRLQRLQPLDYAAIASQLREGEAAIIIGPEGAMAIPASQLFATNLESDAEGVVRLDQRFRGEQLLTSAIVSLRNERMPTVVFVHAQDDSILETAPQQADVSGAAAVLRASRFQVTEWAVNLGPKPAFPAGTPLAWVVIPPSHRAGFEISKAEKRLLEETAGLLEHGDSVLLNLYPSYLPRYGRPDPWAAMLPQLGLEASTDSVLLEETIGPDGKTAVQMFQQLVEFQAQHPIAASLNGQRLVLPLPVPIEAVDDRWLSFASIPPGDTKWLESEWTPSSDLGTVQRGESALEHHVDVAWSLELGSNSEGVAQRLLVVGSGPWLLTNVADVVVSAGGGRMTLLNPGNHELLQSAVAWLAGEDDLVAQGPLSQEVARLRTVTESTREWAGWLLLLGLPGVVLILGLLVYVARRN